MSEPTRGHRDLDSWSAKRGDEVGKPERPDKDMRFNSLHHHSTFSYLDGFGTPEEHVWRAEELGMTSLALTEHGNISSHVRLEQACKDTGVKPIFGCELYTGGVGEAATRRKNHLTVLTEDQEGYRNLLRVVSKGWYDGFYYEPTVSGEMLAEHADGLIVLSGCQGSLLATSIVGGKNIDPSDASLDRGRKVARQFKSFFGDNYYLEVQAFPELEATRNINKGIARLSEELGIPLVATMDCHYTTPSESEMQTILHSLRPGKFKTAEEQAREWGYDVKLAPPKSDKDLLDRLIHTGLSRKQASQAIVMTEEIRDRCNVTLPKMDPLKYPLPPEAPSTDWMFRKALREGWEYRRIDERPNRKDYIKQVKYEMEILEAKQYQDYFLVVSDLVKFAKDQGIPVGPARGSAAASLVCYLMRITEVDPIQHPHLVFERFIDMSRKDLPDIDLDFDSWRRHEIWEYARAKYGDDRVGNIGTFTGFKSKNSLDDVARAYKVPQWEVNKVKERLVERSSGDLRASATIEDTVEMFDEAREVFEKYPDLWKATDLEGNIKGMGVHAAGMIVSPEPLTDVAALYTKKGEDSVISWDKYDAEYLGMLKIDLLGLSTMTLISLAIQEIGMTLQELYDLPLDDEETFNGFRENDVVGIFQFDGRAMREVNRDLKPDDFDEICAVNALARPGPLHSGAANEYIMAKFGDHEPTRYHPMVDEITYFTKYQIVYQEQILQIVRDIGHFDWTEAAYIRKIISRKLGDAEFNKQWSKFFAGCQANGIDEETGRKIWGAMTTAGSYAFNLAHCVSYGLLGYWTMWLKRHHPHAFYMAALNVYKFDEKILKLLRDADDHGIDIKPPSLDSQASWSVEYDDDNEPIGLLAGFSQIKGIGDKMARKIIEDRDEHGPFETWKRLTRIKGVGPKTVDTIQEFVYQEDPFGIHKLKNKLNAVRRWLDTDGRTMGLPYPTHGSLDVPQGKGKDTEIVWLGVIKHRNLRDLFEVNFGRTGEALDLDTVKSPDKAEWVILTGEDEHELINITVDRFKYPKFRERVWGIELDDDVVLVRGIKKGYQARRAVYVTDLWVFDPEDDKEDDGDVEWE
jgi:DNA polymerase III subunit alpha